MNLLSLTYAAITQCQYKLDGHTYNNNNNNNGISERTWPPHFICVW